MADRPAVARDDASVWTNQPYGVSISLRDYTTYRDMVIDALAKTLAEGDEGGIDETFDKGLKDEYKKKATEIVEEAVKAGESDSASKSDIEGHLLDSQTVSDSSIFGNDAINPYSGFCRDDDIVPKSFVKNGMTHMWGMGRVYKEIYDSKQQLVYLQFGIPKYKNLYHFLSNASNSQMGDMNENGDTSVLSWCANFFTGLAKTAITLPLLPFEWAYQAYAATQDVQVTEYFFFREQMFTYYNYVNTLLTSLASNIGLFDCTNSDLASRAVGSVPQCLRNSDGEVRPDIFSILTTRSGRYGADVSSNVTKAAVELSGKLTADLEDSINDASPADKKRIEDTAKLMSTGMWTGSEKPLTAEERAQKLAELNRERQTSSGNNDEGGSLYRGFWSNTISSVKTVLSKMWDGYRANALDNAKWIAFRIEKDSDNATEQFTNSLKESNLAQELNGYVESNRAVNLDAGTAGGGIVGFLNRTAQRAKVFWDTMNAAFASMKNNGNIAGVIGYLNSGNGYYDIPQQWAGSNYSKSVNINIRLRSRTGGDPVSVYMNVLIPLSCILAGAVPRASGDATYTAPFIVRAYCRGMFTVPAGMITSLQITRGDSEFGWSIWRLPTTIALSIQITDLSPILFMGMNGDGSLVDFFKGLSKAFANNSKFQEYMMTLSGLGLKQRIYYMQNVRRKLMELMRRANSQYGNPTWWGMAAADTWPARIVQAFRSASTMNVPNN